MLKRDIGTKGEDVAVKYLKKKKYRILERNFNVPGMGEIDIVAQDKDTLVFAEVRYRKNVSHGSGAETVDIFKQRRLIKAAIMYMKKHALENVYSRFDVLSISGELGKKCEIEHIENAFEVKS